MAAMVFWEKINKTDYCWIWTGRKDRSGYGRTRARGHSQAHRLAYTLLVGPIPAGLQLDHLCRNKLCVNPDHLEPVTNRENSLRGPSVSATNIRKTHCVNGHPFDARNTNLQRNRCGNLTRCCRTCWRENARRYRDRRKALVS